MALHDIPINMDTNRWFLPSLYRHHIPPVALDSRSQRRVSSRRVIVPADQGHESYDTNIVLFVRLLQDRHNNGHLVKALTYHDSMSSSTTVAKKRIHASQAPVPKCRQPLPETHGLSFSRSYVLKFHSTGFSRRNYVPGSV